MTEGIENHQVEGVPVRVYSYLVEPRERPIAPQALSLCARNSKAQLSLAACFLRRETARGIRVLLMNQVRLDFSSPILNFLRAVCEAA
jgi:hypothetical protein